MNQTCNLLQDYWDIIGFLQLKKKKKEIVHTHRHMHKQNLQRLNDPS